MKRAKAREGRGGVALFEESLELLRAASAEAWAIYLAGTIPFVAALLWFSADMSRSLYARQSALAYSFGITLLFLWKQYCESCFLARLHASLTGSAVPAPLGRIAIRQTAVQPWSLLAIPLAILATFPLPSVVFFFRGFSLAAAIEPEAPAKRAWYLARGEPGQAWVLSAVLFLFSFLIYFNLLVSVVIVLQLAKSVFGVEHLLAQPIVLLRSTTVHFGVFLAAYVFGDLVLGAAAVLRFFHGDSVKTGADIRAIVRRIAAVSAAAALLCVPLAAAGPDEAELDRSIEETLRQRDFSWRMPSDEQPPESVNWFLRVLRSVADAIDRFFDWLGELLRDKDERRVGDKKGEGSAVSVRYLMIALAIVAAGLALAVYIRSTRKRPGPDSAATAAVRAVDVHDEAVLADQLEEDSWLRLADELAAKGDYRAALRALHLSGLRFLAERRLVSIQRWKSGLEYRDELRRRARHVPALGAAFAGNLRLFEYGWYSRHAVEPAMLDEFRQRLGEIRSQVGTS